ncbi:hypothetical protein [Arcticibacter sp.]|jgi:hypothetical protein|uniref:hypothetical protein n=1 Tax=Arcticibacter sp. TaxID=1872630 RepID=UPI00388FAE9E
MMQEPFDIEVGQVEYAVFPEENDTYTIFKDGVEYVKIQKDTEQLWLKLDQETDLPLFSEDEEVRLIGQQISAYLGE